MTRQLHSEPTGGQIVSANPATPPPHGAAPLPSAWEATQRSLVYHNIFAYRLVMQLLYWGRYRARFQRMLDVLGDAASACELCFGDTILAAGCRQRGVRWTGVEINRYFCARARRLGHTVVEGDLFAVDLPRADVFMMAAALYHFHDRLPQLFDLVFSRTRRFIVSEPVRNVSCGVLGRWTKYVANPGTGHATYRYDRESLLAALRAEQQRSGCEIRVISVHRDMLVEVCR
jgi:hypothetical protein